jgi:hypothetical protein
MSSTTLSHGSYGIGIICALVEEKAAVEMMLDEEHEKLGQKSRDHNSYTLGRIGKHNVVIAWRSSRQVGCHNGRYTHVV